LQRGAALQHKDTGKCGLDCDRKDSATCLHNSRMEPVKAIEGLFIFAPSTAEKSCRDDEESVMMV